MKRIFVLIVAAVMAFSAVSFVSAKTDGNTRDAVGMSLAGFSTTDLHGNPVTSEILSNTTMTVINEWATWCGPCVGEMPHFQAMHEYYSGTPEADVQIIGCIYESNGCNPTTAQNFLDTNGYTWLNLREDSVIANVFNTSNSIPNTIIVDRSGTVRAIHVGSFASSAALQSYIQQWYDVLVEEEPVTPPPTDEPALLGDMNGDGEITVSDALAILRLAMNLIEVDDESIADMNENGSVEASDAIIALRIAMNLI